MTEALLAFAGFVVMVTVIPCFVFLRIVIKDYQARELRFDSMVRALQNNLSAKDLQGYLALQSQEPEKAKRERGTGRTDEEEAFLESQRMLLASENGDAYS